MLVAQLDRVFGYEPKGQGFESLQARHKEKTSTSVDVFFFVHIFKRDSNPVRATSVKKTIDNRF